MTISYKNIFTTLLSVVLLLSTISGQAAPFWKKKKVKKVQTESVKEKEKSPYDKIFEKEKNVIHKKGVITIHQVKDKIYLEIPFQNMNKDWMLNSFITGSNDVSLLAPGINCAPTQRFRIENTDSLVVFRKPSYDAITAHRDTGIQKALNRSAIAPIVHAYPIMAVNNDSTAVIFDATDLFSGNNKEIIDLRGMSIIDGMSTVYDNSCISKRCMLDGVDAFNNSITVSSEMGIRLTIAFILGISSEKPEISAKITTMLTMLSDDKMKTRESDGRLGTAYIKYQHFGENGSQIGYHAARFRLEPKNDQALKNGGMSEPIKPITIYVDTLFSDSWYNAIREGILRWEKSFEGAGFKNALVVKRIPTDTAFHIYDPYISSIRFTGNTGTSISLRRIADPRTGEMMSFSMNIPRDYVSSIRKESTYTIADVDKRFSSYYIPDDAICEVLSSQIMQKMALAFGLANNLAGSSHYSIAQLRDPQFTQTNGLTTSVTDNVLFNYVAQPGDKEKGVVIISQKPGIYDEFAIKWLYSPVADDEKIAQQWLQEKAIDERFFFGKKNKISYAYDPRCLSGDLSNDIFAATDNGISHLKYVIAESPKWLKDEKIPESYIELFPDFVFLKVYSYLTYMFSYIGGIYQNEPNNALTAPSYQAVPRELQRKAMMKILDICKDFSWMDTNKEFLHLAHIAANKYVTAY